MKAFNLETAQRHPNSVTELYIHNRGLRQLPSSLSDFPKLRKLELSNNRLSELPPALLQLKNLDTLVLSHNQFEQIPEWLHQLPQLKSIDFSYNQLQHLPDALSKCPYLQRIAVSDNAIEQIPELIGQLEGLLYLNLSNNQLQYLPESIGECAQLQELHLSQNGLKKLPNAIGRCRALRKLGVNHNRLKALPESIGQLSGLLQLSMIGNQLTQIPESLSECRSLNHVDLSNNKLSGLPQAMGQWTQLMSLRLSHNQLRELPSGLSQCLWLQELEANRNQLQRLPDLSALRRLRHLNLECNQLSQLPRLPNRIAILRLAKNPLPAIHPLVFEMERLKKLSSPERAPERKQLMRFYKAARRLPELSKTEQVQLYRLFDQSEVKLPLPLLLKGLDLSLPMLNEIIIPLIKQYGRSLQGQALKKGSKIVVRGRTSIAKQRLKKEIEALGMHYQTQLEADSTHILLGQRPGLRQLPANRNWVALEERELYEFLRQHQQSGYLNQLSEVQLERLGQLLTSGQAVNIELALQMISGGGVPKGLLTELFIAYKFAPTASLRRHLRQLLELHCDTATAAMLSSRVSLSPRLAKGQLVANICSYTTNTALDEQKLMNYLEKLAEQP